MTEVQEQLAREGADSLRRASEKLTGGGEDWMVFARQLGAFVGVLSFIWQVLLERYERGGAPAQWLVRECDLLLTLVSAPEDGLVRIAQACQSGRLPPEALESVQADVRAARGQLDSLVRDVHKARAWAATPPRVSVNPEDLKRQIERTDEEGEWLPLREAVARLRHGGPPTKESP